MAEGIVDTWDVRSLPKEELLALANHEEAIRHMEATEVVVLIRRLRDMIQDEE